MPRLCIAGFILLSVTNTAVAQVDFPWPFVEPQQAARPSGLPEDYVAEIPGYERQPDWGELGQTLRRQYAHRLAGSFVQQEPDHRMTVLLVGNEPVENQYHRLGDFDVTVEFRVGAPHLLTELQDVQLRSHAIVQHFLPGAHAHYIDERTGEFVISVLPENENYPSRRLELEEALGVPVRLQVEEPMVALPGIIDEERRSELCELYGRLPICADRLN